MENDFDQIERYFSGKMSPVEITEFDKRRLADRELENQVMLYRQANEAIQAGARNRLKKHLDELGQQEFANTMVESYLRFRLAKKHGYAIAASILLLFGIGYLAYQNLLVNAPVPTLAQLFDRYYEIPSTDVVVTRGDHRDEKLSFLWNTAIQKYSDKQFEASIRDFSLLLQNSKFTNTSAASFYLGICYLNINLPDSAIAYFRKVAPASSLAQDAGWYTGMSYLKAGNVPGATEVFGKISGTPKHYKKKQAKEILRRLSKTKNE